MTVFDVLVYTDAAAEESLSGLSGWGFVAKSLGATATDEVVVRERLVYLVPDGMRTKPWQSHPPTCTFVTEGSRMYLGRGSSTGATLSGRFGNQLTQAIMTSEPFDFLPLRPAQVYSSPGWLIERPGVQELDGWEPPIEISPLFDIGALHELVVTDEWASSALPALLTMLEQTQGNPRVRLIIRHPEQSHVMRWIALLSQFLDAEAALRLEFCVFSENPIDTVTHIAGAHPDLSPELTVARASGGINLVDLEHRNHTPIKTSLSAQQHARWFLAGDPYQALEAVEVSRRWACVMNPNLGADAAELACLVASRSNASNTNLQTSTAALRALAQAGRGDELNAYGDALIDVIEECPPHESTDDLLPIVDTLWALTSAGQDELAQALTLYALNWGRNQIDAAASWAQAHSNFERRFTWPDGGARAHGATMLADILARANDRDLPALFALSSSLDTGVVAADVKDAIDRLAQVWAADHSLTSKARVWLHADVVQESLRRRLVTLFSQGDTAAVSILCSGAWDWLMPQPWEFQSDDPLLVWLAVRVLPEADAAMRELIFAAVLPHTNNGAWELYLVTQNGLSPKEVAAWVQTHRTVPPTLAEAILDSINNVSLQPVWQRGGAARVLHALGSAGVTGLTPALLELVDDQQRILGLFEKAKLARNTVPNVALRSLAKYSSGAFTRIYSEWVAEAVVVLADIDGALSLVQGPLSAVDARIAEVLERQMRAGEGAALTTALRLLDAQHRDWNGIGKRALDAVWTDRNLESVRRQLVEQLAARPEKSLHAVFVEYEEKRRLGPIGRFLSKIPKPPLSKPKNE